MDELVHSILLACMTCQACDKTAAVSPPPMQTFPEGPFQHDVVDIVGPFEHGTYDCRFVTDYFSKWPEVAFTPNATTATACIPYFCFCL